MIISHATVIWRKRSTPVISIHRYLVNRGYIARHHTQQHVKVIDNMLSANTHLEIVEINRGCMKFFSLLETEHLACMCMHHMLIHRLSKPNIEEN